MSWSRARHFALGHLWHHLGLSSAHSARVIHFQWDELRWPHPKLHTKQSSSSASSGKIIFCVFSFSCDDFLQSWLGDLFVSDPSRGLSAREMPAMPHICMHIHFHLVSATSEEWVREKREVSWSCYRFHFIMCSFFSEFCVKCSPCFFLMRKTKCQRTVEQTSK